MMLSAKLYQQQLIQLIFEDALLQPMLSAQAELHGLASC